MTNEELYELSKNLRSIRIKADKLSRTDWYGYSHMVDSSERKFDCGYAKVMKKNGYEEIEILEGMLNDLYKTMVLVKGKLHEEKERKPDSNK